MQFAFVSLYEVFHGFSPLHFLLFSISFFEKAVMLESEKKALLFRKDHEHSAMLTVLSAASCAMLPAMSSDSCVPGTCKISYITRQSETCKVLLQRSETKVFFLNFGLTLFRDACLTNFQ